MQHIGYVHHLKQLLYFEIGFYRHFFRRRIHGNDSTAIAENSTEITAEVGIGSGKVQLECLIGILAL
jgi:hypothetical protein